MGNHTTTSNGGLNKSVQLLVTADGELKVAGGHPLHLQVLAGVTGKLEHLSGEVLEDSGRVDGGRGTNTAASAHSALEESVDSSNGELATKNNRC